MSDVAGIKHRPFSGSRVEVQSPDKKNAPYRAPATMESIGVWSTIQGIRDVPVTQKRRLLLPGIEWSDTEEPLIWYAGDLGLLRQKCVSIVGSRHATTAGRQRAERLARELSEHGVVVVSGLAEGIDVSAHLGCIKAGGRTIAVIGTPLDRAYPAAHAGLQEDIYTNHLLVSPFPPGARTFRSNFPQRNKVMAALTDATVIIEASDTSGSLHQAAECGPKRLDRWLFIAKSVVDNDTLKWPRKFLQAPGEPKVRVLETTADVLDVLG